MPETRMRLSQVPHVEQSPVGRLLVALHDEAARDTQNQRLLTISYLGALVIPAQYDTARMWKDVPIMTPAVREKVLGLLRGHDMDDLAARIEEGEFDG